MGCWKRFMIVAVVMFPWSLLFIWLAWVVKGLKQKRSSK